MASDFFPPGKFIRAASHTNAREAAQATSLAFCILNLHVRFAALGLEWESFTSSAERIITVLSLFAAAARRDCCSAVNTSFAFCNSPEPTMIRLEGAVTL